MSELTLREFASLGGKARAKSLSPERRKEIAIYAAFVREQNKRKKLDKNK